MGGRLGFAIVVLSALGAVARSESVPVERLHIVQVGALGRAGAAADDSMISSKLEAKYASDPQLRRRHLDVTTKHGIVYLGGTVRSRSERNRAVHIARDTKDVAGVSDQLQVIP